MFQVKEISEKQKESKPAPAECRQTALFPLMGHCKDEGMIGHCKDWKDKTIPLRDHSFSTYAKFFRKTNTSYSERVRIRGYEMLAFRKILRTY